MGLDNIELLICGSFLLLAELLDQSHRLPLNKQKYKHKIYKKVNK